MTPYNKKLGQAIRKLRRSREVSQKVLAQAIYGKDNASLISKIENGHFAITAERQQKIADFFGVSVNFLTANARSDK